MMSSSKTVYVVDDDPGALQSMQWLLEAEGLTVEAYSSAREFLAHYDPDTTGCLLLDICMPGMSGLELQEDLAGGGRCPPIVFLTGYSDVATCAQALKRGAFDFLEKPADDKVLLEVIHRALKEGAPEDPHGKISPEVTARIESLTPREAEVMRLMYRGLAQKQIAAKLGITFQTVAKHRARVLKKLEVENEAKLVRLLLGDELALHVRAGTHRFGGNRPHVRTYR